MSEPQPDFPSGADRRDLRARAHALKPVVWISENKGVSAAVLGEIDRALKAHELIKIAVAVGDRRLRQALMAEICERLAAFPVQLIGKTIIVFRQSLAASDRTASATGTRSRPPAKTRSTAPVRATGERRSRLRAR